MKSRTNGASRGQKAKSIQGEGPNWILIAGVALLSTLSIRLGYKLKQTLDSKQQSNAGNALKGSGKSSERRRSPGHHLHTNMYSFTQDNDGCFNCVSGADGMMEMKHQSHAQILSESDGSLPLVTVPIPEFTKENRVMWASSPDCLELPPKPFHHSNCSDSPSVSESGSDIFSRREVIHKLRQQLKRRDDMILEMQDQILELQNSLNTQLAFSSNLQSQLDAANGDLLDSEREIQRLRQAIEAHCAGQVDTDDKPSRVTSWPTDPRNGHTNGHTNGYIDGVSKSEFLEKGKGDWERIELLKREVGELKEVIEGKEYLLRSYKEQKTELSMKIKELQQRLDSHVPSIL